MEFWSRNGRILTKAWGGIMKGGNLTCIPSTALEEATQEYDCKAYDAGCTQSVCSFLYCIMTVDDMRGFYGNFFHSTCNYSFW